MEVLLCIPRSVGAANPSLSPVVGSVALIFPIPPKQATWVCAGSLFGAAVQIDSISTLITWLVQRTLPGLELGRKCHACQSTFSSPAAVRSHTCNVR